jgi:hypothetical protein
MSTLNFYDEPYWDDFEVGGGPKDNNYMRILFRPGYAVQARELTQIQSIIQNQIKQFGNHIFQNGSPVTGGHLTLDTSAVYIKLEKQFSGNDIDLENFLGLTVYNQTTPKTRAKVIQTYSSSTDRTLLVKYLRGANFQASQTLTASYVGEQATILSANFTGKGSVVSINDGIFYVDGYFVQVAAQTIVLDPYSTTPTYRVGLQIEDDIVTESEDAMLLDPAQESFNYQAPGAHRYKFNLILAKRSIDSVDDSRFFELMRVENGVVTKQVSYPIYSELEKTLARRTYDESGDYTVKPFRVNVTANTPATETSNNTFIINVEPGKAYVKGFEYETIGTKSFSATRARTYNDNLDYNLSVEYGNYIKVTNVKGNSGGIGFSTNYDVVDIHCVDAGNISFSNTQAYYSTRIGTARVKNFDRDSLVDIYKVNLVDVNFNQIVGIANGQSSFNQVGFDKFFSAAPDAYRGGKISILTGDAAGQFGTITGYTTSDKVATVDKTFTSAIVSDVKFSLTVPIGAAKSIAIANTSTFTSANLLANIAPYAFGGKTRDNAAFIADTSLNKNIFELPNQFVTMNGFRNVDIYRRYLNYVSFISAGTYTLSLTDGSIFPFGTNGSALSTQQILDNIIVVARSNQAGGVSKGDIVDMTVGGRSVTRVSSTSLTFNSGVAAAFDADIYVTVKTAGIAHRTKVLVESNTALTTYDLPSAATSVVGYTDVKLNLSRGIAWYTDANVIYKTPEQRQSLYVSDVIRINKIYDSANVLYAANIANTSTIDITDRYTFDSGQNDNYYDHASIMLKPGSQPPRGQTCVLFDYYQHTGPGYLAANSYPSAIYAAEEIPIYKALNGKTYPLRDCIDLRPIRANGISAAPYITTPLSARVNVAIGSTLVMANTSLTSNAISPPITTGTMISVGGQFRTVTNVINSKAVSVATAWALACTNVTISTVTANVILSGDYLQTGKSTQALELDYQYYLPRIDKVVVTKDKEFKVLTGAPSLTPQEPIETDGSMPIYLLYIPAYTSSTESIDLQFIDNRRYTMKDISYIDQRLSVVEEWKKMKDSEANIINNPPRNISNTASKPILGTLVDEYNDLGSADLTQDFSASLENGRLTTYKYSVPFSLVPKDPTSILLRDKFICLNYTETPAVTQEFATPEANSIVQTSVIGKFDGFITLSPESDYYYSTEHQPAVTDSLGRLYQIPQPLLPISNPIFMGMGYVGSIRYAYSSGYYNNGVIVSASQPTTSQQVIRVPDYSVANTFIEPTTTVNIPITTAGSVDVLNRQWYGLNPTLSTADSNQYLLGYTDSSQAASGSGSVGNANYSVRK